MSPLSLSLRSMLNRKWTTILTLFAISLSVTLLLSIERIREGTKDSFSNAASGIDLIVGGRGGSVQLLLFSVFNIGNATSNLSWESYEDVRQHPDIEWTIPLSMGDTHRGFKVIGTTEAYFEHFKVGSGRHIFLQKGQRFRQVFEAVVGSDVAELLKYDLGKEIILAHGDSHEGILDHDDRPFHIVGILGKTGTPVDRVILVSLESVEAMHFDWHDGAPPREEEHHDHEEILRADLSPQHISTFLIGLKTKLGIFPIQRMINEYKAEPLLAILPGMTFRELWSIVSVVDTALLLISFFVIVAGILGMLASLLTTLESRKREIAILRSLGARPASIFALFLSEALLLGLGGCLVGALFVYPLLWLLQPVIESRFGMLIPITHHLVYDMSVFLGVVGLALIAGSIPAWQAYKRSLSSGLTIRI
ncbi:MAG: ABC transporter permease [Deltaproteobacteria bacterium]|nr:ABC transporter permease [Deltaproteobacteria bacterium]